jgi:hypothetical protein
MLLMFAFLLVGCFATMSSEERKDTYDLRNGVGGSPFVGYPPGDRRALFSGA